jgi:hypothetical protein
MSYKINHNVLKSVSSQIQGVGSRKLIIPQEVSDEKITNMAIEIMSYIKNRTPQITKFVEFCKKKGIIKLLEALDISNIDDEHTFEKSILAQAITLYAFERVVQSNSKWSVELPYKKYKEFAKVAFYPVLFSTTNLTLDSEAFENISKFKLVA